MNKESFARSIVKEKFNLDVQEEIGIGAQGTVFSIKNTSNVIKISALYDWNKYKNFENEYENISQVYNFIINNKPINVVSIFEFNKIHDGLRKTYNGEQRYIIYFSIQERLNNLTEDEKKVFKTVCQSVNNELDSSHSIEAILKDLSSWYDFDLNKIIIFYNSLKQSRIEHKDFHIGNIMKDKNNNYKMIDFDLAQLKDI